VRARWSHLAGFVAGGIVLALLVRRIDPSSVGQHLARTGPRAAAVLVPTTVGVAVHALAWRALLGRSGARLGVLRLASVHLAAEAVRVALPGGAALGELAAARGVHALGVGWNVSIPSLLEKRACLVATNGLWLLALVLVAQGLSRPAASLGTLVDELPVTANLVSALAAVGLVVAGAAALAALRSPALARRLPPWLGPLHRRDLDVTRGPGLGVLAFVGALLLGQWAAECAETWTALHVVELEVSFLDAARIESLGALSRALAFFVPAGIGVQDASYLSVARALGIDADASTTAAFLVLKRAKDVLLVAVGLVCALRLSMLRPPEEATTSDPSRSCDR
jgi:hypothetical protein